MSWVRGLVVVLATIQGGFMVATGSRALLLGDYFNFRKGPGATEPAVWERVVASVGVDPDSLLMKLIFLVYGCALLVITYQFARGRPWGRAALLAAVVGSLWYLGPGTPLTLAQILLLILLPSRRGSIAN